jgi:RNA polymerase sigma factor (TIGR02999 family)
MSNVTRILESIEQGDSRASQQLFPLVYEELRRMAAAKMAHEAADHTLQPTALVHEAYLRLVGDDDKMCWDGRAHFFAAAAEAMRRILVDRARRRMRPKHGGDRQRLPLDEVRMAVERRPEELLSVDEALEALAQVDEPAAQLVKLRYFGGCTFEETAKLLGISTRAAYRDWSFARAWLRRRIDDLEVPEDKK